MLTMFFTFWAAGLLYFVHRHHASHSCKYYTLLGGGLYL